MLRRRLTTMALALALAGAAVAGTTVTTARPAQAERSEMCTSAIYRMRVSNHMYTWYNVFCGPDCPETSYYYNQMVDYLDQTLDYC